MQFSPHLIFYSSNFYILYVRTYTEIWLYIRSASIYVGGDAEHADRVWAFVQFDKKRKIESFKRCGKSEFGGTKDESFITFSQFSNIVSFDDFSAENKFYIFLESIFISELLKDLLT